MTECNENKQRTANSGFKKLAVQWLNEVQFFNQTFVQVDSFVLRNRQLLKPANRYLDTIQGLLKKIISGSGIPKRVILHSL